MGSKRKKKFYVVWTGKSPGVFETWADCDASIQGFPGAKYKSFPTLKSAKAAFDEGPESHWGANKNKSTLTEAELEQIGQPVSKSLCVDAAWNAQTKVMEYQGVWNEDQTQAFHQGPFKNATNNIGEFLAIVHGLAMMQNQGIKQPLYSDSKTAISWIRKKQVKSKSMKLGETSHQVNELV